MAVTFSLMLSLLQNHFNLRRNILTETEVYLCNLQCSCNKLRFNKLLRLMEFS